MIHGDKMAEAGSEHERVYTDEQLHSDEVTKKDILKFLQEHAGFKFLKEHHLKGKLNSVAKTVKKEHLVACYNEMFEKKEFRKPGEVEEEVQEVTEKTAHVHVGHHAKRERRHSEKEKEDPKYTKKILKHGNKSDYPQKGDKVSCYYVGKLLDGTVFDTNIHPPAKETGGGKKKGKEDKAHKPLTFAVGTGKVIRGWDEALLTMSKGEKAEITIEPDWAYGRKGKPEAKIPPHATLVFEVELVETS